MSGGPPRRAAVLALALAAAGLRAEEPPASDVAHLRDFGVVELRRYTLRAGTRERFARCFESWFPEAFEQLGAIAFGHFRERARPDHFTWLRGFHDLDARARVNAEFYYGPLWREHRRTMNDMIADSDDVLLLHPVRPEREIPVLPAVDPTREAGASGVVVAQILPVEAASLDEVLARAEATFAAYRAGGLREAGLLATLDVPNNFPQLPVRTDGPYVVWLGLAPDDAALAQVFTPAAEALAADLAATRWLRGRPEVVLLDPAARSRLRWIR